MSAIPIVIEILKKNPNVAALAGPEVHAITAPQGTPLPNAVVSLLSEADEYTMGGAQSYPDARVSVVCRAQTAGDAIRLGDAAIEALKNVDGLVTVAGAARRVTVMRDQMDSTDYTDDGKVYRRMIGFRLRYRV